MNKTRVLLIDNFDSFTFNLVAYFKQCNCTVDVKRNTILPELIDENSFDILVLSPGPGIPKNSGNLMSIIQKFYNNKSILGICLGHQAIIEFFGGTLKLNPPKHGKTDVIQCDQQTIYQGLPQFIEIGRYHSLAGDIIPQCLNVSATSQDGTIMSIRHQSLPIEGVQFHPESILSAKNNHGLKIIENAITVLSPSPS